MDSDKLKKFECSICHFKFKTKAGANRHFSTSHENKQKYKCDYCHYRGSCLDALKKHLEIHRNEQLSLLDNTNQAGETSEITPKGSENKVGEGCVQPTIASTCTSVTANEQSQIMGS